MKIQMIILLLSMLLGLSACGQFGSSSPLSRNETQGLDPNQTLLSAKARADSASLYFRQQAAASAPAPTINNVPSGSIGTVPTATGAGVNPDFNAQMDSAFQEIISMVQNYDPHLSDPAAEQAFNQAKTQMLQTLNDELAQLKNELANAGSVQP